MNRFGFIRAPEANLIKTFGNVENGMTPPYGDADRIGRHTEPPTAVFYSSAESRDIEMQACAKKFPGTMFCPVELTKGMSFPAAKNPAVVEISAKGVTPF